MDVAHAAQMRCFDQLGPALEGYQVHATLDQNTRPEHAARNGQRYMVHPTAGQLGLDKMPHPPREADGSYAHSCRCWLSPLMAAPSHIARDPAKLAVFENASRKAVPDPSVYSEWFDRADVKRRKLAVGARRYSTVANQLGDDAAPSWEHFVNPETGSLLPLKELQGEAAEDRAIRIQKVRLVIAERRELLRQTSTYGFILPQPA